MTKLKMNLGVSGKDDLIETEIEKLKNAIKHDVDKVSVISIYEPNIKELWEKVSEYKDQITLCSVPLYESVLFNENIIDTIKRHISYGVKVITIHPVSFELMNKALTEEYYINSRGGTFCAELIRKGEDENPNLEYLPIIKNLCKKHNLMINLGSVMRSGRVETTDFISPFIKEELQELVKIHDELIFENILCEIETFGHVAQKHFWDYHEILQSRSLCTMGPLVTDTLNGFDDLNALYGYVRASEFGFNIKTMCLITRAEHISLPSIEDDIDAIKKAKSFIYLEALRKIDDEALAMEKSTLKIFDKQNKQCSSHVNVFGKLENIPTHCNVCGDRCPLEKIYE